MASSSFRSGDCDVKKGDTLAHEHEIDMKENQHSESNTIVSPSDDASVLDGTEETTSTASSELIDLDQEEEDYWTFPDLAVIKILKFTKEQKALLNSRLVCTQWNNIIQDTSKLMNKIVFYVSNLQEFIDLTIVKRGKVKSVVINTSTPSEHLDLFVDAISSSIENVTFTLNDEELSSILKLVLVKCANLQALRLDECFRIDGLSPNIIEATEISAANKISILSVTVNGLKMSDVAGLSALLLKLNVLKELEFNGDFDEANGFGMSLAVTRALNAYLEKRDSTNLQKLSLKPIRNANAELTVHFPFDSSLKLLFVLCGKHGIIMEEMPFVDLEWLLNIDKQTFDSILHGPLLLKSIDGFITFNGNSSLESLDRFHLCTVGKLKLGFLRDLVQNELSSWFVNQLPDIEELTLQGLRSGSPTTIELDKTFSIGYHSLKALNIWKDYFDPIKLPQYFPNLNELHLYYCSITPDNLIAELTKLQSLTKLRLLYLPNLADVAFTMKCVVDRITASACNNNVAVGPAIACFKSLKYLYLESCPLLTNTCVINGIHKSKTLEEVIIMYCKGITKEKPKLVIKCKQENLILV